MVGEGDLADLLPLVEAYCVFYGRNPGHDALEALARELMAEPDREGRHLIARDGEGRAVGFATLLWSWSTPRAARLGIMNDLFVAPEARGSGAAEALIQACVDHARAHGACALEWATARDNHRAQAVYDRFGGVREDWLTYGYEL
ncbi:MAG TPA: GNAT family N-acetyltransferase [Capillimicrobium sp.]|nr:GNAT family N-acetyltransferase [Capillimicrobium sp.]